MTKKYFYIFLLFLCLIIQNKYSLAQTPIYKHFNTLNGMTSNAVYSILYDKEGYIWIGTDNGVSRFNGKDFVHYSLADGLSDIQILKIKQDSKGRIWFLAENGTVSYWLNGKIFNSSTDSTLKNIVSKNSFRDFHEDDEHDLWFFSIIETLVYHSHNLIYKFPAFPSFILNSSKGYIRNLFNSADIIDKQNKKIKPIKLEYACIREGYFHLGKGKVLFISKKGVVYQNDTIQDLIVPMNNTMNDVRISNMLFTKDSLLWFSAIGKGLYCYNLKNKNSPPSIYLKNKLVNDVTTDDEGNIWATTLDEGVFMIPNYGNKMILYDKESGFSDSKILALCKQKNDLLIGVFPNKLYLKNIKQIVPIPITVQHTNNKIIQIKCDDNNIWVGLEQGLLHINKNFVNYVYELPPNRIRRIANIKDLSIGKKFLNIASGNGLVIYSLSNNFLTKRIEPTTLRTYSIFEDYKGIVWYGAKLGLKSFDGLKTFSHYIENILLKSRINSIAETADSTLILATNGYGILFYKQGKIILNITDKNGLSSNICKKAIVFGNSIYVVTNNGISILKYIKGKIFNTKTININNYLQTNEINDLVIDSNYLYIATNSGLLTIENNLINLSNSKKPIFYLTDFSANNSLLPIEKFSQLPFNKNNIRIKYIGIYYQQPNAVIYRYRLKNNQEWKITNKNVLEFPFLEPDNYNFEIQSKILNGNWTASKFLNFEIKSPFYKQIWFIILLVITCLIIIVLVYNYQMKIVKKRQAEKDEIENTIARLKQQALQSLMNPHFIFNVMNSLQQFINLNNKESANKYLSDFAKLMRLNLDISSKQFVSIEEELNYLKLYLSFEKLRFGNNLIYVIIIDPSIDVSDSYIPVMMIQPFVENAIWHGILPTQTIGKISLNIIQLAPDLIKVIIEDNGIGIKKVFLTENNDEVYTNNHALSMTNQRLKLIAKTTIHKLTIQFKYMYPDKKMKGTVAEILLPIS